MDTDEPGRALALDAEDFAVHVLGLGRWRRMAEAHPDVGERIERRGDTGHQLVPGHPDDLPLDADTVLLEKGLALDSVAVLELLIALEKRFDRRIEEHELTPENLASVGALARLLTGKLTAPAAGDA